ncbi:proteasome assembly chaperone family protein [Candidatus Woesearchaeota archaeon]|nr:proteasome assembly chaperone family protein [Candidatus Woesearchaeota archaeon]
MRLELEKKPKGVKLIAGFPGFGLIGTIATEFLIEHLNAVQIGKIRIDELPPIVAVHQGQVIEPLGVFYSKKYNLVILHALTSVAGIEWALQNEICKLMDELKVKELITIEGIGSTTVENMNVYYLANKKLDLKKININPLKEGIILGVSGALLLRGCANLVALFVETHSTLPDSRGAAKIIEILDKYLGLKVDYKPLMEKAVKFENKIKELMAKKEKVAASQEKKELTYLG